MSSPENPSAPPPGSPEDDPSEIPTAAPGDSHSPAAIDDLGRSILESIPLGLITVDQKLRVLHANRAAEKLLDRAAHEAAGCLLGEVVTPRILLTCLEKLSREDLDPPRTRALDPVLINDIPRVLHVTGSRRAADLHVIFVIEDVTERMKAREAEEKYQSLLIKNERLTSLAGLISGVAHELNNPLSIIVGYADLLMRGIHAPGLMEKALEAMNKAATRCRKTVTGLLKFARENQPDRREIDVKHVIEEAIDLVIYQLRVSDVRLTTRFEPIPMTIADGHQLLQVFFNLLNNAYQAMVHQNAPRELRVACWESSGFIRVEFADSGPGIPEQHLESVFRPFFTTKEEGVGTGLGLSIAYGILREHGGTIRVASTPGTGTTFTCEIPVGDPAAQEAAPGTNVEGMESLKGRRILVVDDEPGILEFCAAYFSDLGAELDVCCDGSEAIELTRKQRYDLILLDIRMPGLTGRDIFTRLNHLGDGLGERVVFMTGDTADPSTLDFLKESNRPHLFKPFTLPRLERVLIEQLGLVGPDEPDS